MGGQGNTSIEFTPKQAEAMDAIASEKYTFILFGGAMGGGKTFWGLSALLIMCQVFKGSRWCVIRENTEKIRTTTIPSFKKLKPSGKLRENPYEYTHPNGSQILFKGENYDNDKELDWLKGFECSGFLFEEINECKPDTLDMSFGRAGRWDSNPRPKPIIMATCNPNNGFIKERVYDRWKLGTLPKDWLYIQSKVTDNPFLTSEYLENLKNMPTYKYMVFVEGNWDVQLKVGGEFYKCFELEKHVSEVGYNPDIPLHISWDDNVNPYLPCGVFQMVGKHVKMIDEICAKNPNNTVKWVCSEIVRKYQGHKSGMFIYGDATARKDDTKLEKGHNFFTLIMEYLKEFRPSLRVLNSNPSVAMRGSWINTILEKQIGGISLTISKKCTNTITDFVGTKEAADGTKNKEMGTDSISKVRYQKYGHMTDLTDYMLCFAFMSDFINYQKGTTSRVITTGKTISNNSF